MNDITVMICLESLGIGGVETAVINQASAMIKKGIKVIVLARDGIYKSKIVDLGAKFIYWKFELNNHINFLNINKITDIIKSNNVTHVIINQFPCINDVVFSCLLNCIPYIAYIHSTYKAFENDDINQNVYEYFKKSFTMFNIYFNIFFKYASKIITITPISREYIINKYNVKEDKVIVIPNCIDFDNFFSKRSVKNIQKYLLISRFSEEKMISIKAALNFFNYCVKTHGNKNYVFKVIGGGNKKEEIESYIKELDLDNKIEIIGEVTNVKEYIDDCDVVFGVDRCLLEAISMKRLAVICGYDGLKGIVNSDNIKSCIDENFSGRMLKNISYEELSKCILNDDMQKIREIIEYNYKVCKEKLDINKNIYYLDTKDNMLLDLSIEEIFKLLDYATKTLDIQKENIDKLKVKNWEINNKYNYVVTDKDKIISSKDEVIENKDVIIKEKQFEIDKLNIELQSIYSSRSYKMINKIKKFFNKK